MLKVPHWIFQSGASKSEPRGSVYPYATSFKNRNASALLPHRKASFSSVIRKAKMIALIIVTKGFTCLCELDTSEVCVTATDGCS